METKTSWSDLYIEACLETGETLPTRISAASHAIAARLQELSSDGSCKERRDMEAALTGLRALESQIPR
jgi:hypothetical protein